MVVTIINVLYYILIALVFANIILSWIPNARWHPLGRLLLRLSEPLLLPFRRLLRPVRLSGGVGLDLAPLAFIIVIQILRQVLLRAFA